MKRSRPDQETGTTPLHCHWCLWVGGWWLGKWEEEHASWQGKCERPRVVDCSCLLRILEHWSHLLPVSSLRCALGQRTAVIPWFMAASAYLYMRTSTRKMNKTTQEAGTAPRKIYSIICWGLSFCPVKVSGFEAGTVPHSNLSSRFIIGMIIDYVLR